MYLNMKETSEIQRQQNKTMGKVPAGPSRFSGPGVSQRLTRGDAVLCCFLVNIQRETAVPATHLEARKLSRPRPFEEGAEKKHLLAVSYPSLHQPRLHRALFSEVSRLPPVLKDFQKPEWR